MSFLSRLVRRQNAHSAEEIFCFSEDLNKAALLVFSPESQKILKSDDVCQDKHGQHTWRFSGQKRSKLRLFFRVFRPLLSIVLEKGPERFRSKKDSCFHLLLASKQPINEKSLCATINKWSIFVFTSGFMCAVQLCSSTVFRLQVV